jgi:hypothetical protein
MGPNIKKHLESMSEEELKEVLRKEYLRRLTRYKWIDELFRKKYGLTFEEFEKNDTVAKENYSWEVESDAQDWEAALDGINTALEKLRELSSES